MIKKIKLAKMFLTVGEHTFNAALFGVGACVVGFFMFAAQNELWFPNSKPAVEYIEYVDGNGYNCKYEKRISYGESYEITCRKPEK